MFKYSLGILCGLTFCAALKVAHKIGYDKGVKECTRLLNLAAEVEKKVKGEESK